MTYTYKPEQRFAKASGSNMNISTKDAAKICKVIRGKKLTQVKRLLNDLLSEKRSLNGKYYTKAVNEIKTLLGGCEKNAEFRGLNMDLLFVHASAHQGSVIRRRRRKAAFGSRLKSTNLEIMLIEKGKIKQAKKKEKPKKDEEKKTKARFDAKEKPTEPEKKEENAPATLVRKEEQKVAAK